MINGKTAVTENASEPIVIVGGGFTGSSLLIHLLTKIADDPEIKTPVDIVLAERDEKQLHRGLAYNTACAYAGHNLNIGSKRVTPFPAGKKPDSYPSFVEYIQQRAEKKPELMENLTNPSRQFFGEYIKHLAQLAVKNTEGKARVKFLREEATRVNEGSEETVVSFRNGKSLKARHVILATGFKGSLIPHFAKAAADKTRFIANPYSAEANTRFNRACKGKEKSVLIVGTGLTAMDIAGRLLNSGYKGHITMMSRRNLMHTPYGATSHQDYLAGRLKGEPRPENELPFTQQPPKFLKASHLEEFVRAVKKEYTALTKQGYSSEEIIGYWERFVPDVVAKFPKEGLAGLLAQHETFITSHRVGVTPAIGQTIKDAVDDGRITIKSASIENISSYQNKMRCAYKTTIQSAFDIFRNAISFARSASPTKTEDFDFVFLATGNSMKYEDVVTKREKDRSLWEDLFSKGKAQSHWTNIGIAVNKEFSVLDKEGTPAKTISAIGVPVAGHMIVTAYDYAEKPGAGGRLGPTSLNVAGITTACVAFMKSRYDDLVSPNKVENEPVSSANREKQLQAASAIFGRNRR